LKNNALSVNRICERIQSDSDYIAKFVWARILPFLTQSISIPKGSDRFYLGTQGTWKPHSLNSRWRFCRYFTGGLFSPHQDGDFVKGADLRSLYTVMIYLTTDFEGGHTDFLDKEAYVKGEKKVIYSLPITEPGMCIVFNHSLLHEGAQVTSGMKLMMRTDAIFNRESNNLDSNNSTDEEEAMQLLKLAEDLERSQQGDEAVKIYKLVAKKSPKLAAMLGLHK